MNPLSPNRLVDNALQLRRDRSEHRVRRLALQFVQQEQFYAACVPVDQLDRVLLADDLQMTNFLESCRLVGVAPLGGCRFCSGLLPLVCAFRKNKFALVMPRALLFVGFKSCLAMTYR